MFYFCNKSYDNMNKIASVRHIVSPNKL